MLSISNRVVLAKALHIEKLMKRNKVSKIEIDNASHYFCIMTAGEEQSLADNDRSGCKISHRQD